ncbi:hypothetical protein [Sinirhodobacter huangdaonensis]|uniref:Uncharacterized protein n=1 Tax=Paenirhodobacter huangdaonensis TaxID=2501515 RepID=A0A3S3LHC7_9RHOB|nr:hypothetical protein [Sinirhodobacter huangdaonensis]RWR54894.1 hypothetical protein EOW66_02180 [Sinirhodobacter huangdaonensis]
MITQHVEIEAFAAMIAVQKTCAVRQIARALGLPDPYSTDADRVARLRDRSSPPDRCGPEIIAAPARGPMIAFSPIAVCPKGEADWEVQHAGYRGRDAARGADAFDLMDLQARRRGGDGHRMLFSAAAIRAGRDYAALIERHDAAGLRGVSVETMMAGRSGGTGDGGYIDAVISDGRRIRALRLAIGGGSVFARWIDADGHVIKPGLSVRDLVDQVCCGGQTVSQVIRGTGRSPGGTNARKAAMALADALRRMSQVN